MPPLARWLLAAGIGATLFANVLAGAAYGLLGTAVAAWPALAPVGSYELMWLVRHSMTAPAGAAGTVSPPVPSDAETAAMASLRARFRPLRADKRRRGTDVDRDGKLGVVA